MTMRTNQHAGSSSSSYLAGSNIILLLGYSYAKRVIARSDLLNIIVITAPTAHHACNNKL